MFYMATFIAFAIELFTFDFHKQKLGTEEKIDYSSLTYLIILGILLLLNTAFSVCTSYKIYSTDR